MRHPLAVLLALSRTADAQQLDCAPPTEGEARVAVVVGLNGAMGRAPSIDAAERDARRMAEALCAGGYTDVRLFLGTDADREAILGALGGLRLGSEDTVVAYIGTHGTTCGDDPTQHLRVRDTRLGARCWEGSLTDRELEAALLATRAGRRALIIDACMDIYAAGEPTSDLVWSRQSDHQFIMRSTSYGLAAYQDVDGVLLFTDRLIEAMTSGAADLDGDSAVTAQEAFDYARDRVRARGLPQVPSKSDELRGDAEVVLYGLPRARTRSVIDSLWELPGAWTLGGRALPLGSSGRLPVVAEGPLEYRDRFGLALRVWGLGGRPRDLPGDAWLAGRIRGVPSAQLLASLQLAPDADALQVVAPGLYGLILRAHEPLLSWLALGLEVGLASHQRRASLAADLELDLRRSTAFAGPRASLLWLEAEGAPDAKLVSPALGLEAGLRWGAGGPWAITLAGAHERARLEEVDGEHVHVLAQYELRLGLLMDPRGAQRRR